MWRGLQYAVHFNLKVENWHRSPLNFSAAIVQWCVVTVQCGAGPGGEALVHKSQTVRPRDEWSNTNCRICAHKYQMGTNPRWEAARNTNCRWKKSQLQMGEIRGEMQEIRRGRVRMQIARGFPPNHRTFSIFLRRCWWRLKLLKAFDIWKFSYQRNLLVIENSWIYSF